jgi:hypothetical protein
MGNHPVVEWASEKHEVLVCEAAGEELVDATFAHDERALWPPCRALDPGEGW